VTNHYQPKSKLISEWKKQFLWGTVACDPWSKQEPGQTELSFILMLFTLKLIYLDCSWTILFAKQCVSFLAKGNEPPSWLHKMTGKLFQFFLIRNRIRTHDSPSCICFPSILMTLPNLSSASIQQRLGIFLFITASRAALGHSDPYPMGTGVLFPSR